MKYTREVTAFFLVFIILNIFTVNADPIRIKYQTDEKYPPYAYRQGDELLGFDFELANMIFADSSYEIEYSADVFADAYDRLVKGETDSAGIIAYTEEREMDILYTDTVLKSYIAVFTREDGPHFKIDELKNYKVGVGRGFYTEEMLKEKAKVLYYYTYNSVEDALIDLEKGRIDAVFGNQETINFLIVKKGFKNNIVPRIPNLYPFDLAIGVSKNNPELVSFINERLKFLKKNGYFELLHQKYFSSHSSEYYEKQRNNFLFTIFLIVLIFISIVVFLRFYIKRLEKRIIKSNKEIMLQKAYFDQLFENSPQATVIIDLDDNIINLNASFERLYGYKAEEIIGQKLSSLILPKGEENEGVAVNEFILTTKIFQDEVKRKRKDGTLVDVSLLGLPIIHEGQNIGVYGIYTDISERKQQEETIKYQAYYDSLTQLPNRYYFMKKAESSIAIARNDNKIIALLFVDLDKFKRINDSLGHNIGDKLLIEVGCRLNSIVRKNDLLARMGGDEFIIMLRNLDSYDVAFNIAKRIHESLSKVYLIEDKEIHITASTGIAFYPDDGIDAETLLKNSDIAMYMAKEKGRNNYQVFSKTMNEGFLERLSIEQRLKTAIEKDELVIHYQPLYNAITKDLAGVEALVRWNHPEKGLILPDLFIPIAEESGLIIPMGYWVFENACKQVKKWHNMGFGHIVLSVNLSMKQFQDKGLISMIESISKDIDFEPWKLNLEITESVIMKNVEYTMETMKRLSGMGVSFSLDDFGTGYSSMNYLKKLPISTIKIDRTFVKDMEKNLNDRAIALAIIELAHSLNLEVVAEGVETEKQLELLIKMKCDGIQGYFFSKPLSVEDFYQFLDKSRSN